MVDDGVFTETEIGIIGSCLFFTYAIGKFCNGFIADRSNEKVDVNRSFDFGFDKLGAWIHQFGLSCSQYFGEINGYFQSMGAASGVVSLSRSFDASNRGTYYGYWSASHNLGEAITFISIAILATNFGWRYGLIGAGLIGIAYFFIMQWLMKDTPQKYGYLLEIAISKKEEKNKADFNASQKTVLCSPAIWILALASAFMYISRYAVNSWGVFYLETRRDILLLTPALLFPSILSGYCGNSSIRFNLRQDFQRQPLFASLYLRLAECFGALSVPTGSG